MNDSQGINISGNKNIIIGAEDNLIISSEKASLLLAAYEDIHFTGGEFRI